MSKRNITIRRNVQQVAHCALEALAVIERGEDLGCAVDDLTQCRMLLDEIIPKLRREADQ
jgi:hypothetical protein